MKINFIQKAGTANILIYISFFIIALITTSLGVLIKENTAAGFITVIEAGYIVAGRSFGYLIGAYVCTKIYDKADYPRLSFFYYLFVFGILIFLTIYNSPVSYIISFTLFGIVKNLITVGGNQHFSSFVHSASQTNTVNIAHFIYGLGTFVSPLILGFLAVRFGHTKTFIFLIILVLVICFLFFRRASSKTECDIKETNSGGNIFNILLLIIFFALYASCELFFGTWGPYILNEKGFNDTFIYILNSLFWLTLTFSRICILPFSGKCQDRTITLLCIMLSLICCVLLLTYSAALIAVAVILSGLCMGNIVPCMVKFVRVHKNVKSSETAWCFFGAGAGEIISSNIYSRMLKTNTETAVLLCMAVYVSMLIVFIIFAAVKLQKNGNSKPWAI